MPTHATPAIAHAFLADARVDATDIPKLKDGNHGPANSAALHIKYPFITKATFDTLKTNMTN